MNPIHFQTWWGKIWHRRAYQAWKTSIREEISQKLLEGNAALVQKKRDIEKCSAWKNLVEQITTHYQPGCANPVMDQCIRTMRLAYLRIGPQLRAYVNTTSNPAHWSEQELADIGGNFFAGLNQLARKPWEHGGLQANLDTGIKEPYAGHALETITSVLPEGICLQGLLGLQGLAVNSSYWLYHIFDAKNTRRQDTNFQLRLTSEQTEPYAYALVERYDLWQGLFVYLFQPENKEAPPILVVRGTNRVGGQGVLASILSVLHNDGVGANLFSLFRAPDVAALQKRLQELGTIFDRKPIVCGHSLGANIALMIGLENVNFVEQAVLFSPHFDTGLMRRLKNSHLRYHVVANNGDPITGMGYMPIHAPMLAMGFAETTSSQQELKVSHTTYAIQHTDVLLSNKFICPKRKHFFLGYTVWHFLKLLDIYAIVRFLWLVVRGIRLCIDKVRHLLVKRRTQYRYVP